MDLVLVHAKHDADTRRAYVEFGGPDGDGGDAIVTVIFSYKNIERLSKARVQEEIERLVNPRFKEGLPRLGTRDTVAGWALAVWERYD